MCELLVLISGLDLGELVEGELVLTTLAFLFLKISAETLAPSKSLFGSSRIIVLQVLLALVSTKEVNGGI